MSGQEDLDLFGDSSRLTRTTSVGSAVSVQSTQEDDVMTTPVESQDLLAEDSLGGEGGRRQTGQSQLDEDVIRRAVKKALEPLMYEVKRVKKQNEILDKKVTQSLANDERQQKLIKELKGELSKGVEDLSVLLTSEGIQKLKGMCLRNLDMKAKEDDETALLQKFMDKANEEGWMIKKTAKAEKDITSKYRDNRNYLKSQIRLRVFEDLSNKTPTAASKLPKTVKFLREHLVVPELSNDMLLVVYNYVYTVLKYLNKNVDEETMTGPEKQIKKKAKSNTWSYVMERVDADRKNKKEASAVKDRIFRLLENGLKFDP